MSADFTTGDRVICNGHPGTVVREYMPGMFEVRLSSGEVVVPAGELKRDEPDCDNCPQPHDEYNEPDCDACDEAWSRVKPPDMKCKCVDFPCPLNGWDQCPISHWQEECSLAERDADLLDADVYRLKEKLLTVTKERDGLRCCGNCHWSYVGQGDIWCEEADMVVSMKESCVFSPSRWMEAK